MGPQRFDQRPTVTFLAENWPLILLACLSGGMLVSQHLTAGVGVDTQEAVRLINREKGVLIDVSDSADFAKGHVAGSRNVPVADLASSKEIPSNKALPIVLVCADGGRSSRAVNALKKAGYEKTVSLRGGLRAWKDANLPMDKKAA